MKKFLFVDLDDTLFQSRRKCLPYAIDDLKELAYLRDGSPISYATPMQMEMLAMLQREMTVIPVTARTRDAFHRVKIDFDDWAITTFGGVLQDAQGRPDPVWHERISDKVSGSLDRLRSIGERMEAVRIRLDLPVKVREVTDCDLPFYLVAKVTADHDETPLDTLEDETRRFCDETGDGAFRIHRNGNNLAILPVWLDKRHAVSFLIERLQQQFGPVMTIGMGDSLSDLGFMGLCDYMLIPGKSQIAAYRLESEA